MSGSSDRIIRLWDLSTCNVTYTLIGHTDCVNAVAVTRDGQYVISASRDQTIKVWDIRNRCCVATFTGDCEMTACDVAPDGHVIIAGDALGSIHILRLEGV